jgi:hypothetical protein
LTFIGFSLLFVLVQTHAKAVYLLNGPSAGKMGKKEEEILQEHNATGMVRG